MALVTFCHLFEGIGSPGRRCRIRTQASLLRPRLLCPSAPPHTHTYTRLPHKVPFTLGAHQAAQLAPCHKDTSVSVAMVPSSGQLMGLGQ